MRKIFISSLIACMLFVLGGACDGVTQTLLFHYGEIKPYVKNETYWNPYVSWVNKYKNYEGGDTRAKYVGSKTFLAFTTDAYHLYRFLFEGFVAVGWVVFAFSFVPIWAYLRIWSIPYTLTLWYLAKALGFHIIYTFVF